MTQVYIGYSGFHYRDWKGIFYPEKLPQTNWFEFYCYHFNTLEINSSFYKFPTEKSLIKWYQTSPEGFKFSLKVPRLITHYKKFSDCDSLLNDFYTSSANGLKDKFRTPDLDFFPENQKKLEFFSINSFRIIKFDDQDFSYGF